jgi:isoleucyl-tRNA synthetase
MNELAQWGIMTDWRYSYFTLMPAYQAMVIRTFGELIDRRLVLWSDRPVLWSTSLQRILAEEEIEQKSEIIHNIILKLPITKFGEKSKHIQELYPDVKLLVNCKEPWMATGIQAVSVNNEILYVLAKYEDDYVIVAEKRIGEISIRTGKRFKKLMSLDGLVLNDIFI